MILFAGGQLMVLPGWWTAVAAVVVAVGATVQAVLVEEPYLRATHGADFERWARTTGRFAPRLGEGGRRRAPAPDTTSRSRARG